jgi:hypothetical protein
MHLSGVSKTSVFETDFGRKDLFRDSRCRTIAIIAPAAGEKQSHCLKHQP